MTSRSARLLLACLALFAASCIKRDLRPLNPCITSGVSKTLSVTAVDKVDLLLVVDNSNSMQPHQAALQEQFPNIIQGLVSGDPELDGTVDYPPVASLRVAVVSTDLGVGGVGTSGDPQRDVTGGIPTCGGPPNIPVNPSRAYLGDNGVFNRAPLGAATVGDEANCDGADGDMTADTLTQGTLPDFLTFDPAGALTDDEFADRIGCYAVLGTGGCGFEQQLESMLKSLTPQTSETRFFAQAGSTEDVGQGDRANAGWLREDALLAVLMVTDEDDCSANDGRVFNFRITDSNLFSEEDRQYDDSHAGQQNTRCVRFGDEPVPGIPGFNDPQPPSLLRPVDRYAQGLIDIKGDAAKVVFGLITGVPVRSVDGTTPGNDGVGNLAQILDPAVTPAMGFELLSGGPPMNIPAISLRSSCYQCPFGMEPEVCLGGFNDLDGNGQNADDCDDTVTDNGVCDVGEAFNCVVDEMTNGMLGCQIDETEVQAPIDAVPPRRLVRAVQEMQEAGISVIVQSICANSFSSAITGILRKIAEALNGSCLPNPLNRNSEFEVACQVVEVLPPGRPCSEFAAQGRELRLVEGDREACTVAQVAADPATQASGVAPTGAAGWFYDDFTDDADSCGSRPQRISFTAGAAPILGSTLRLECSQSVPGDLEGPDVGDACTAGGGQCTMTQDQLDIFVVRYNLSGTYTPEAGPLVCQSESNTCQVGCTTDANCPGGYVCFDSEEGNEGTAFCADPTCQE